MPAPRKDNSGGNTGRADGRTQNGNRGGFQTDSSISNSRFGHERTLQRWMPDANDKTDGSLEKSSSGGHWDQFAENERLFGLKTDYDENMYTTQINKNHPQYRERIAAADKKAREIERSVAATAHVAEERVMDYVAGTEKEENEEDKYSGVRRQDFPPLANRENKYTPPAKRAPAAHSTVKGAPIDPAIISSQIKVPGKKQTPPVAETTKNGVTPSPSESSKPAQTKPAEEKATEPTAAGTETKPTEKASTPARSSANGRNASPQVKEGTPSATSTVERDVLKEFKSFANQQRENAQKVRSSKAKADKEVKLTELKKFANSFKLSTPVPTDLVSIIAKDPVKQKEIQAKALKNAEEVAKTKTDPTSKDKPAGATDAPTKSTEQPSTKNAVPEPRAPRAPNAPQGNNQQGGPPNRHPGHRQQYPQQQYQPYRNNRGPHNNLQPQQPTGNLAQRIRNGDQHKFSQPIAPHQHAPGQESRAPPTGPANNVDQSFNRRLSGVPSHMGPNKLNPNSHEFRPSSLTATLNQNGHPSAGSSPKSVVNNAPEPAQNANGGGQLIRRKTKSVDVNKCYILSHIKTIPPPQGRNWDDNGGLRPAYDTLPTWRQLQDDENKDSNLHLSYQQLFERQPFGGSTMATPNPPHVVPHMAHQHQLPFHLQQGGHNMGPRQSPHLAQMQMHTPQHGPGPHPPYGGHDDHRMVHSNSAQSFASPRLGQVAIAYPGMNSPGQVPYHQPVFMGPGTPQMQFRSFSNNPQYMPPQQGQMGGPMMMQPPFVPGPQGIVGGPQIMYPGGHPHFISPGGPPQPAPGTNGYPSPGRPAAPMMTHQGSQQGQPMYGMSPNIGYSQPAYGHGQPGGPMSNTRGYNNAGPQHFGTSPQQPHQFVPHQHRRGSNSYNKNYGNQGQNQQVPQGGQPPAQQAGPGRVADGSDEAK